MPDFPGRQRLRAPALFVLLVAVASAAPAREDQILALVMKGGRIYDPARIEQALGIAPRDPSVH
jgi:hypothetical protein